LWCNNNKPTDKNPTDKNPTDKNSTDKNPTDQNPTDKNPTVQTKKIAIIIGINYYNDNKISLKGPAYDSQNIIKLLIDNYNYKKENIYILTDYTILKPTFQNIINLFNKIIHIIKPYDTLFFYFSGHGIYNALVTYNLKLLFNFDIKNTLINKLPKNTKLFGLIDSCHSENEFNLPYIYSSNKWSLNNYNKPEATVCMLSACKKNQVTNELVFNNLQHEGLITHLFINILRNNIDISWYELIKQINSKIKLLGYDQSPILSSYNFFNLEDIVEL